MNIKEIEAFYTYLGSQQTAQQFLEHCYKKLPDVQADIKSYDNCQAFLYYLSHGKQFYDSSQEQSIILKPLLLFYGMTHLIKACLLTKRPDYPESTSLLAHGVSTRKRKKRDYSFLEDEVKLQHNGLFPYFSEHLFQTKAFPTEKVMMEDLLKLIPELTSLFHFHEEVSMAKVGHAGGNSLTFPRYLLDRYHLTERAFLQRIQALIGKDYETYSEGDKISLQLQQPLTQLKHPFYVDLKSDIYFPASRNYFISMDEVMIHYLLLYNLSMLSRYEAEWWGDLIVTKSTVDYPFIEQFLHITTKKIPILLGRDLLFMTH